MSNSERPRPLWSRWWRDDFDVDDDVRDEIELSADVVLDVDEPRIDSQFDEREL